MWKRAMKPPPMMPMPRVDGFLDIYEPPWVRALNCLGVKAGCQCVRARRPRRLTIVRFWELTMSLASGVNR